MTGSEMVTKFSFTGATVKALMKALNAHLKALGIEAEEYGFDVSPSFKYSHAKGVDAPLPTDARWFIAFAVEGSSEGYYVHLGSMKEGVYTELGLAKMNTASLTYRMATEAQRFLTAAAWN